MTKVLVLYYSMYGHIFEMAKAVMEGAKSTGVDVKIKKVPETLSKDALEKMGASQKNQAKVEIADPKELTDYDAIVFGTPTRI